MADAGPAHAAASPRIVARTTARARMVLPSPVRRSTNGSVPGLPARLSNPAGPRPVGRCVAPLHAQQYHAVRDTAALCAPGGVGPAPALPPSKPLPAGTSEIP